MAPRRRSSDWRSSPVISRPAVASARARRSEVAFARASRLALMILGSTVDLSFVYRRVCVTRGAGVTDTGRGGPGRGPGGRAPRSVGGPKARPAPEFSGGEFVGGGGLVVGAEGGLGPQVRGEGDRADVPDGEALQDPEEAAVL